MATREHPSLIVRPAPDDPRLSAVVPGIDQDGNTVDTVVVTERPLTLFLNAREIVTMMTIGDHPELLALGYLLNQGMLKREDDVTAVEYHDDLETVVVRTRVQTNYEEKLKKKVQTSGCAQGTVFGDLMSELDGATLNPEARITTSGLYALSRAVNMEPSLYLKAGAIHGCVLAAGNGDPLVYMEDVGRHNAVDKIAGYMFQNRVTADDKVFYTTGRLTSEMVLKTVKMGIPILVSRSGFTAWGVELAQKMGLTLVGRLRGKRFVCLAGRERLIFDADPRAVDPEDQKHGRKGSSHDD
jgi:FdhD protein